jgi:hypothetical protein
MRTNLVNQTQTINPNLGRLLIAHNALDKVKVLKPTYFIERATIKEKVVEVFFIDEDILNSGMINDEDWKDACIDLIQLETFAIITFQDVTVSSDLTVSHYIDYNLPEVVKSYLEAGKEVLSGK